MHAINVKFRTFRKLFAPPGVPSLLWVWPSPRFPTPLHPRFRSNPKSNTKYYSDAVTRKKLLQLSQSTQASCNLLRNSLKTSRLITELLWNEDRRVTINANNQTKRRACKYHWWCHKQRLHNHASVLHTRLLVYSFMLLQALSKSSSNVTGANRCGNAFTHQKTLWERRSHPTTPVPLLESGMRYRTVQPTAQ